MLRASLVIVTLLSANTGFAETPITPVPMAKQVKRQAPKKKVVPVVDPVEESSEAEEPSPDFRARPPSYQTEEFSRGQIGVELLGPGLLYSFNGSFRPARSIAINAGISSYGINDVNVTLLPVSVSGLFGEGSNNFEILGGVIPVIASGKTYGDDFNKRITRSAFAGQVGVGFRHWPVGGGFHFRAMLFGLFGGGSFLPWPGFNFGYAF